MNIKKTFFISFVFVMGQIAFLSDHQIFNYGKSERIPFVPYSQEATTYSGRSMDLVDINNVQWKGFSTRNLAFYIQVYDDEQKDFFNDLTEKYEEGDSVFKSSYFTNSGAYKTTSYWIPQLSNLSNDTYYFRAYGEIIDEYRGFYPAIPMTYGYDTNDVKTEILKSNVNDDSFDTIHQTPYNPENTTYPYIGLYDSQTSNDIFNIDSFVDGTLTFTIKVVNWIDEGNELLAPEETIGITLENLLEENYYYKFEQYEAHLTSENGEYYTYEVYGLNEDTDYQFYSLNFSGLTVNNSKYGPEFQILLEDELNVPVSETAIIGDHPYVESTNGDALKIDEKSETVNSVTFTLKVIDTSDLKFVNFLNDNNNQIEVTLIDEFGQKFNTTALWDGNILSEDTYSFTISNLEVNTSYELYSINNTNLALYNNGKIDTELLVYEDLGVNNKSFKTNVSTSFVILIITILLLMLILILLFTLYLITRKKKVRGQSKSLNPKHTIENEF